MPYYAPFYRPAYYDQTQPNPAVNQFGQPFQQTMQTAPVQMQPQPTNDFLWVLNENEATSYPVAPNNTVTLWDKNLPTIYIKSVNSNGVPSMRVLDFTERSVMPPRTAQDGVQNSADRFVTLDTFNALEAKLAALEDRFEELKARPTAKSKKTEVEDNV